MWRFKDPSLKLVLSNGRGELNSGNLTDEKVEELIKENPKYLEFFEQVEKEEDNA